MLKFNKAAANLSIKTLRVNKLNTHFTHASSVVAVQLEVRFGTNFWGFVLEK